MSQARTTLPPASTTPSFIHRVFSKQYTHSVLNMKDATFATFNLFPLFFVFIPSGVFLICWVPFFTANILDAICAKLDADCRPGVTVFILTTWLGYMNSFVNPVIYTIFNPEFRKAFKKIMHIGT